MIIFMLLLLTLIINLLLCGHLLSLYGHVYNKLLCALMLRLNLNYLSQTQPL